MRLIAFLLAAGLSASAAAGAPATATSAPAPAPAAPDPAREHYERGLSKYNLADFDGAILEFKHSYELSKAPRLLFNLAQAYRLKREYESALFFYNTYLRSEPSAPNREDVEAKIAEMRKAMAEAKKPPPPSVAPPKAPLPPPPDPRARRRRIILGLSTAGAGVVLAGVGGGLLGLAAHDSSQLHDVAVNRLQWSSRYDSMYHEGERSQTAGVVLLATGGALLAAGGVYAIVSLRRHH